MPKPAHLVLLFFLLLYLLFPTANSTLDAWYYAGCVRHGTGLFLPHHLLYNAFGWLIYEVLQYIGLAVDALVLLKVLNALFAAACLAFLSGIMRVLGYSVRLQIGWLFVAGASFGVWRFATENEVYVLPILLSVSASFCWLKFQVNNRLGLIFLAGFLAALACLFHQVQVFWWLGLLVGSWYGSGRIKALLAYALPAIVIPLAYTLVLVYSEGEILRPQTLTAFVLHDFQHGTAGTSIGLNNFVFTGISLVRTFVQVHGLLLHQVAKTYWWALPAIVSVILVFWALLNRPFAQEKQSSGLQKISGRIHLLIVTLHLFFAWFAVGNAEFMVMIPFLLPLLPWLRFSAGFLQKTGAALLVWNFCYGIYPNWNFKLSANDELAQMALKQPETLFILTNALEVNNRYFYRTGAEPAPNVASSPSRLSLRNEDPELLHFLIGLQDSAGLPVITDCFRKPEVFSRSSLIVQDTDSAFFSHYKITPADSILTFYGWQQLHRVQKKN